MEVSPPVRLALPPARLASTLTTFEIEQLLQSISRNEVPSRTYQNSTNRSYQSNIQSIDLPVLMQLELARVQAAREMRYPSTLLEVSSGNWALSDRSALPNVTDPLQSLGRGLNFPQNYHLDTVTNADVIRQIQFQNRLHPLLQPFHPPALTEQELVLQELLLRREREDLAGSTSRTSRRDGT